MPQRPDEEPDLKLVEELLFDGRRLRLERFDRAETLAGRTPDFKVLRDGALVAFCEVKSPRDDWLDEQLEDAKSGEVVGGARSDPTFNRIARHVAKAVTQFEAVNAKRDLLNVLAFVNHAGASGYHDLRETVTGMFHTETGDRIATMSHISDGRLKEARMKIDLYVWIDKKTRRIQGYLLNEASPVHLEQICTLFGLDKNGGV